MPGGGGTSTTTPAPTPEQTALTQSQVDIAQQQLVEMKKQDALTQSIVDAYAPLIPQQAQLLQDQLAQANSPAAKQVQDAANQLTLLQLSEAQKNAPIQDQILQLQLDQLKAGGAATPQQQALIDAATKSALASGTSDINQWITNSTRQIAQQLAPSLGLRPTDQPVIDRAGLIATEGLRQVGKLQSDLQTAGVTAKLNLPLAIDQAQSALGTNTSSILQNQQTLADQLAQQATANRLQLFGTAGNALTSAGNLGLGLASIGGNMSAYGPTGSTTNTQTDQTGQYVSAGLGAAAGVAGAVIL